MVTEVKAILETRNSMPVGAGSGEHFFFSPFVSQSLQLILH